MSSTVTVEVHVDELPAASVTVKVTVLGPISEQLNAAGATDRFRLPLAVQLSEDPLLTWPAVMEALPEPFRVTVRF